MKNGTALVRQHLGLVVTGGVFVTIGLRVLAASRGDVSSALALLQNADPVEVVVGMGIQLLPWLPLLVASIVVYLRDASSEEEGPSKTGFTFKVAGVALITSSLLGPFHWVYVLGLGVGIAVLCFGLEHARRESESRRRMHTWSRHVLIVLTTIVYLLLALSPTMWLPRERIAHREERTVGFVLKSDFVATVVLTSRTRAVKHILTSDLEGREICVLKEPERPLLFRLIGGAEEDYPRCRRGRPRR
jgi:hypothetical protein